MYLDDILKNINAEQNEDLEKKEKKEPSSDPNTEKKPATQQSEEDKKDPESDPKRNTPPGEEKESFYCKEFMEKYGPKK